MFGAKFKQNKKNVTTHSRRDHTSKHYGILYYHKKTNDALLWHTPQTRPNAAKEAACQISSSDSVLRAEKA